MELFFNGFYCGLKALEYFSNNDSYHSDYNFILHEPCDQVLKMVRNMHCDLNGSEHRDLVRRKLLNEGRLLVFGRNDFS